MLAGRLLAFMAFSISYTTPTRWLHVWAILTIMTPLIAFITSRWFSSALLLDDDEDEDDVDVIAGVVPRARHSSLVGGMSFVMSTLSDPPVDGVGVLSVGSIINASLILMLISYQFYKFSKLKFIGDFEYNQLTITQLSDVPVCSPIVILRTKTNDLLVYTD